MCLVWIVAAAVLAPFHIRRAGLLLALCPAFLAVLRLVPGRIGLLWTNRSRTVDAFTMGLGAALLITLTLVLPGV